jgi:hypothetical protein
LIGKIISIQTYPRAIKSVNMIYLFVTQATSRLKVVKLSPSLAGSVPLSTATMPSSIHPTPVTEPTIPYVTTTYSEVEHALNVVKEKTRTEAHTLNAMMENVSKQVAGSTGTGTGTATIKVNGQDVKICKILDPDCEACQ